MMTRFPRWSASTLGRGLFVGCLGLVLAMAMTGPASADRKHRHYHPHYGHYYGPPPVVYVRPRPYYYAPPPAVYYAPPPVYYAPPIYAAPSFNFVIPLRIR